MAHLHQGVSESSGWSVLLTLLLVVTALIYLRGWFRARASAWNTMGPWRPISFLVALPMIWIAVGSPIAVLNHELLTAHMIQHLLLMTLAPPLIWLGEPIRLLSYGLSRQSGIGFKMIFRFPSFQQIGKLLVNPFFALLAASAVLVGWHIPVVFAYGMKSQTWHAIEQISFFVTGLLFWWPVIHPWPSESKPEPSIILYLFFATLPCDILSGFLVFCERVVYPMYSLSSNRFGLSALADQQCAAALMWTAVTVVYFIAGAILTMQLLSPQHSRRSELAQNPHDTEMPQALSRTFEAI